LQLPESPSVEFKAGASWQTLKIAIIKTVLAMSNLPDGGLIVIGLPETEDIDRGVNDEDLATFDSDVMLDQIGEYASPRAIVNIAQFGIDGRKYVGIEVSEFEQVPVVCKKGYNTDLRNGGVYIRPFSGRPRSTIIGDAEDMRSVLDLAIDKGIQQARATAARRGFVQPPNDDAAYAEELTGL
jgi:predicted HTH transcriptional regulator